MVAFWNKRSNTSAAPCFTCGRARVQQRQIVAPPSNSFRRLVLAGVLLVPLGQGEASAQESYPSRAIRIIVPTGPGGGSSDLTARLIAQGLSKKFGQQVVVENRPGAASIVGSEIVAKAPADGYTLLVTPATLAINPATYKKMPYLAQRDFAPITQLVSVPSLIVIHPSLPVRSVRDFIALAKARPRQLVYGSPGHGSHPHLTIELFASMAQIRMLHVPYSKGAIAALVDLLAGRIVAMATSNLFQTLPHLQTGKLRALGITGAKRSPVLPEVPTIAEAALTGYEAMQWSGLLAPAETPREIVGRLHKEVTEILRSPEAKERLATIAAEVVASSPEAFSAFIKAETVKWAKVAKVAGIEPE